MKGFVTSQAIAEAKCSYQYCSYAPVICFLPAGQSRSWGKVGKVFRSLGKVVIHQDNLPT